MTRRVVSRARLPYRRARDRREALTCAALFTVCGFTFAAPFVIMLRVLASGDATRDALTLTVGLGAATVLSLAMAACAVAIACLA